MKKTLTAFFLCISVSFSFSQVAPPTIMPGFGPTYSIGLETPGINVRTYYAVDHHFCFGPEISFFLPATHGDIETRLFEANLNLHYIFELSHRWGVYPLGGINYSIETERDLNHNSSHALDFFGANVGAGFHYVRGPLLFFAEYKYLISDLSDHFPTVGVLYNLKLGKHNRTSETHE